MTFPMPFFSPVLASVATAAIQGVDTAGSTSDLTIYTFSGLNFGAEASDRYLAVFASGTNSGTFSISSVSIGGVSATEVVTAGQASSVPSGIYIAAVPTGATGDVVLTFNSTMSRVGMTMARITGISSATATDTASDTTSSLSAGIDIPAGGVCFGGAVSSDATPDDITWTNLTELEQINVQSVFLLSCSGSAFASAQTGLTVSATETSGTAATSRLCLAAFA